MGEEEGEREGKGQGEAQETPSCPAGGQRAVQVLCGKPACQPVRQA